MNKKKRKSLSSAQTLGGAAASSNGEHQLFQDTFEKFSVHQTPLCVHSTCTQCAASSSKEPLREIQSLQGPASYLIC